MAKRKLRKFLWGAGSFCSCLILYLTLAFFMLPRAQTQADTKLEGVPYGDVEDFSVLLACDELGQFCGITVYPDENRMTAVLFDSRADAEGYRDGYSRRVEYTKMTEIDVIGRIGGIVIETKNGYNGNLESGSVQRLFGSRVLEFTRERDMRADVAKKILCTLLSLNLNRDDYNFIFSTCSTDISYVDFCEYFALLQSCSQDITVTIG